MTAIINRKFREWAKGKSAVEARISIYEKIRDIPYAIVPELISSKRYVEIFKLGRGSCTPKHFLLSSMYERLGIMVLYAVYPFRWADVEIDYPPKLRELANSLPISNHLACRVEIEGRLVLVDATVDLALGRLGLPVNSEWDGLSDTLLPIEPLGEEQLYHPYEAAYINVAIDDSHLAFYSELNSWLEEVRKSPSPLPRQKRNTPCFVC